MTSTSEWTHHRARVASLTRSRASDDPDLVEARRNMRAARLADHVERALADLPPLSETQRTTIARLLVGGGYA